jgi:hypothetical protein
MLFFELECQFPDSRFKEQNSLIEEKVKAIFVAKDDDLIEKYNLEKISDFVQKKLGNLPTTFEKSDLGQKKMLLGSIYPLGLPWDENGYSNLQISQFYSSILTVQKDSKSFGGVF